MKNRIIVKLLSALPLCECLFCPFFMHENMDDYCFRIHAFDCLDEVHHQMGKTELIKSMEDIGYKKNKVEEKELPNGKRFVRIDFIR